MNLTKLTFWLFACCCNGASTANVSGHEPVRPGFEPVSPTVVASSEPTLAPQDEVRQRFGETVLAGRYVLRWGMEVGQKFKVQATQQIVSEISGPLGTSGKRPAGLMLWLDWEILESDDTSIVLLQTFRQLKMDTALPGVGQVSVDTQEPAPAAVVAARLHADLLALVGRQMQLQMDRLGNVKKMTLLPRVTGESVDESSPGLGQESLKTIVGQMVQFPKTTRAIGETWGTTIKTPRPNGTAEISTEYTLIERLPEHPEQIRITAVPRLTLTTKDNAIRLEEQSAEGYLIYDDRLALVRETSLKQTLKFSFSGDDGGQQSVQSTMTLKIDPQD
jgi:hypothetical protein